MTKHHKQNFDLDVRASLQALEEEMSKPAESWPLGYNKAGIPIVPIPPSLYDAMLKQDPDADMSMYHRHELPKVGAWTHPKDLLQQHATGKPMPGWEVPLHVGIDHGAPEGDRTVLAISDGGPNPFRIIEDADGRGIRLVKVKDAAPVDSMPNMIAAPQSFWEIAEKHPRIVHKSRAVGTSESIAETMKQVDRKSIPMLTKQVDRILSNHGRARPPQMPRNLRIYIRPSYPWFHSCGYAVGQARVSQPLKPMRILALAVQYLVLAPTLTHQA